MPAYDGYDIDIGGTKVKLVRDRHGAPQLRYLDAPDEAGAKGQIGTIVFDNLHHGLGPDLALEGDRHVSSNRVSSMRPGRIEGQGAESMEPLLIAAAADTGPVEHTVTNSQVFATSIQWEDDIYFITPTQVIKFAAGALTGTYETVTGLSALEYIRGPGAFYRGLFFFGLQDPSGLSIGHVVFDPGAGTWETKEGGTNNWGSLFFAVHTELWCLRTMASAGNPEGVVNWLVKYTNAEDASLDSAWTDATVEVSSPFPTGIHPLGRWLLVFGAEGEIIALADGEAPRALIPAGTFADRDYTFGVGVRMWGDRILIPGARGLYALSLAGGGLNDISPVQIQGALGKEPIRPSGIAAYGPDILVGTYSDDDDYVRVLGFRKYPDASPAFYNQLATYDGNIMTISGAYAVRAIEVLHTGANAGRAYVLVGNATEGRVMLVDVSPPNGGRPPSIEAGTQNGSYTFGGSPGRKIFLQVRGWLESALADSFFRINVGVDGVEVGNMIASITAAGPFIGNANRFIGRAIAPRFDVIVTTDNGTDWPVLLGPVFIDYMDEPQSGRRIEFDIDTRGGYVRGGMATSDRISLFDTLKAWEGTQQTLILLESSTSYTVLVEQVEAVDRAPGTGRERPRSVIRVITRVL